MSSRMARPGGDFYPFIKVTLQPQTLISDVRHNCTREVQLQYSKMCLNVKYFLANEQNKEIILVYIKSFFFSPYIYTLSRGPTVLSRPYCVCMTHHRYDFIPSLSN